MTAATGAELDGILCEWHQWQRTDGVRGFGRKSLVCGDYRSSRQYDDANGALDAELDNIRMRAVDGQVIQMQDPHRSAIYANARALVCGAAVWSSPRLPADKVARTLIVDDARALLVRRLFSVGVMC